MLTLTVPPALEPLAVEEAKGYLRVDHDSEDDLIASLVTAAREHAEAFTRRALLQQTWTLALDCFPRDGGPIALPKPPLQAVTSVVYVSAADGSSQTWESEHYTVAVPGGPYADFGSLRPLYGECYPQDVRAQAGAVTITFVAGYGAPGDLPHALVQALRLLVSHWYDQRSPVVVGSAVAEVPLAVDALLWPFRVWSF